jgi:hypothetical protein
MGPADAMMQDLKRRIAEMLRAGQQGVAMADYGTDDVAWADTHADACAATPP